MPNDLNELDEQDIGLKMVMGSRFQDETADKPNSEDKAKTQAYQAYKDACALYDEAIKKIPTAKKFGPRDAQWEPVPQKSFTQKLMTCGKKAAVYAGLCLLIFYWQSTGQMEASAAMPCMMACTALIGVTYGRVFAKEMF